MSEASPTLTEIRTLLANWLDMEYATETMSAPITTQETSFLSYQAIFNPVYGLNKINTGLVNALNGTSDFLAGLLQKASDAAAGATTLIDRTGELAGGSGFGFADLPAGTTLVSQNEDILAAIAEARWFLHEWVNEKGDHIITNILTSRGQAYEHKVEILGALVERRNELQGFIRELQGETHTLVQAQAPIITGYVLERHAEVIAAVSEARLWVPGQVNANTDLRVANLYSRVETRADQLQAQIAAVSPPILTAISGIPAPIVTAIDAVSAPIVAAVAGVAPAVKADADAQTAWVLGHMNDQTAVLTQPIQDAVDALVDPRADVIAAIDALPAVIKTDADAQTAYGIAQTNTNLEYWSDRNRDETRAAVQVDGEAQRDAVLTAIAAIDATDPALLPAIQAIPAAVKEDADAQTAYLIANATDQTAYGIAQTNTNLEYWSDRNRDETVALLQAGPTDVAGVVNAARDSVIGEVQIAREAIRAAQDDALAVLNANGAKLDQLLYTDPEGGYWDLKLEEPWNGVTYVDGMAEVYVVEVDQLPPTRPRISLGGDDEYMPHMGWCALRALGGWERGPMLEFNVNTVPGGRVKPSGILIYSKPGTSGVVRGYDARVTP